MSFLRGWGVVGLLFAAALWLSPGEARAFPDEPYSLDEGKKAHTKRFHILGELGMFAGKRGTEDNPQRSIIMSPLIEMRLQLAYSVLMQVVWRTTRFVWATRTSPSTTRARRGNSPIEWAWA
jgi:hypothetical protein